MSECQKQQPEPPKRMALVNDVTGFGRCSVAVELPVVSALGVQGCILPTSILSVHTGFPDYFLADFTPNLGRYIDSWRKNGLQFDGILTGFMGSEEQIEIVRDFVHEFKRPGTKVFLDPVMGDYGRLYASYTPEMCDKMRVLLEDSDLVKPNLTEACRLLGRPYPEGGAVSRAELEEMAVALSSMGPAQVVITGLPCGDRIGNYVFERETGGTWIDSPKIGGDRSGNGDAFAAILSACILRGAALVPSVRAAAEFLGRALKFTESLGSPWNHGLAFEPFLGTLRVPEGECE